MKVDPLLSTDAWLEVAPCVTVGAPDVPPPAKPDPAVTPVILVFSCVCMLLVTPST